MPEKVDVVVVGTGLAGLTAALSTAEKHKSVIILEKSAKYGGNSIKASSGINGVPTKYQPVKGDTVDLFIEDALKSGKDKCQDDLIRQLTSKSSSAIYWLVEHGINLLEVSQLGGHSMPRTHRGNSNLAPGYDIIRSLIRKVENDDNIQLRMNSRLTGIRMSGGKVTGVVYQEGEKLVQVSCDNLILATGGYAADTITQDSLIKKYRPDLAELPTTNAGSISGDGIKIASRDCGVKLIDMSEIQINPTGFVNLTKESANIHNKILCAELLRGIGGILVSPITGKRFVNEMGTRDVVSDGVFTHCRIPDSDFNVEQKYISLIIIDPLDEIKARTHINFYQSRGLLHKGTIEQIEAFAKKINKEFDKTWLIDAFESYNSGHGYHDQYQRKYFGSKFESTEFYYGATTPVLHFSMGGIAINVKGQAYNEHNETIDNLYAVGEIAGGVHGRNRLGGNSLLECVVFAREAAANIQ